MKILKKYESFNLNETKKTPPHIFKVSLKESFEPEMEWEEDFGDFNWEDFRVYDPQLYDFLEKCGLIDRYFNMFILRNYGEKEIKDFIKYHEDDENVIYSTAKFHSSEGIDFWNEIDNLFVEYVSHGTFENGYNPTTIDDRPIIDITNDILSKYGIEYRGRYEG